MATWGEGAPARHSHDYAPLDHRHQATEIDGAPDLDYILSDELEDRLRDFKAEQDREVDDKLADIGTDREIDELVGRVNELRDRMKEMERDRAAIIRRMRLLEDALSLTPPAETLTSDDAPPL